MVKEPLLHHLLARGSIDRTQAEEALRTRDFFGGELATHLLKLGYVDEATLGRALSRMTGVPYVSAERLRTLPDDARASLTEAAVERYRVCPFQRDGDVLRVATIHPRDGRALRELSRATGLTIEPWVTTEYRLYQALQRHFGIRRKVMRGISLAPPAVPRRASARAAGADPASPEPEIGLDGRPLDADPSLEDYFRAPGSRAEESREISAGPEAPRPAAAPSPPREAEPPGATQPEEPFVERLCSARDRDELAETLMEFCSARASRAALFAVIGETVHGIAGRGRGFGTEQVRKVEVRLGSSSIFDTLLHSREFYFGSVPALPVNRDLYTALGGRLPDGVLLLPVRVRDRVAAILYLDDDDRPMKAPDIPLMRRVAARAGLAFEILLLRGKIRRI